MEHWRFTGGAAGSSRYGLLGTNFLKIHLWYVFAVIYFTSVVQIFLCNLLSPKAKGGLALAQSAQELITTWVTHSKQPFGLPETSSVLVPSEENLLLWSYFIIAFRPRWEPECLKLFL